MAIIPCTIAFLLIIYFAFRFKLHHSILRCKNTSPEPENTSPPSSSNIPTSEYTKAATEMDVHKKSVPFTGQPLRLTN